MSAEAAVTPPTSLGDQIDEIHRLKSQKKKLEADAADVQSVIDAKESILLLEMDRQNVARAVGRAASASVNESVVPQITDWDDYYKYIRRHSAFELLERRPATAAWREHAEKRRDSTVPGSVPFRKRSIRVSKTT